jgi:hypothetical protein
MKARRDPGESKVFWFWPSMVTSPPTAAKVSPSGTPSPATWRKSMEAGSGARKPKETGASTSSTGGAKVPVSSTAFPWASRITSALLT